MLNPTVHILTCCPGIDEINQTLMAAKSIRTGFPNARVVITDNASFHPCRATIREAALSVGAEFIALGTPVNHCDFMLSRVMESNGCVVFCDSDVTFWESMEGVELTQPIAGRVIPTFYDKYSRTVTLERIHTSLMVISHSKRLLEWLNTMPGVMLGEFHPFRPLVFKCSGNWIRMDTGAAAYHALAPHVQPFGSSELDKYDHLFCGSHKSSVSGFMPAAWHEQYSAVSAGVGMKRGFWMDQDEFFGSASVKYNG